MTALYHMAAAMFCRWRAARTQRSADRWLKAAAYHEALTSSRFPSQGS